MRARRKLAAAVAGLLLAGAPATAAAAPLLQGHAQSCSGVWLVVDFGDLGGGTRTACAPAGTHGSGRDALVGAGFTIDFRAQMLHRIDGLPADGAIRNDHYWSYWQSTRNSDGSYAAWKYSNLGAAGTRPEQGTAEGWRFITTNKAIPPQVAPPAGENTGPSVSAPATAASGQEAPAPASGGEGAPIGLLATVGVLVAGGGALVGWRVWKGRSH